MIAATNCLRRSRVCVDGYSAGTPRRQPLKSPNLNMHERAMMNNILGLATGN
jgi:hypothetical protein